MKSCGNPPRAPPVPVMLLLSLLGHTQSYLPQSQNLTLEIHSFGAKVFPVAEITKEVGYRRSEEGSQDWDWGEMAPGGAEKGPPRTLAGCLLRMLWG